MVDPPAFGVLVTRLCRHRGWDLATLSTRSGVAVGELQAMCDGAPPTPLSLRRLALALGLHAADLFVIAGATVPDDLAPLEAEAADAVSWLVASVIRLRAHDRRSLIEFVRAQPQRGRPGPTPPPRGYQRYPPGVGGVVVRLLATRNLTWSGAARMLALAGGPSLSAATIGAIGHGRRALTPPLVAAFATMLAIQARDLAAVTGIELPKDAPPHPAIADVADLVWEARRLTAAQVRRVHEKAQLLLSER